jgi:hypothetical protein
MTLRGQNLIAWITIIFLFGLIEAIIILSIYAPWVWDDAYMHVRYADNLISTGQISWNPGGEHTFGLTSMLYVVVVTAARLAGLGRMAAAVASSMSMGLLFLLLLGWILTRHTYVSPRLRLGYVIVVLVMILVNIASLGTHFISGMDTTFSLFYVALYLWAAKRHEANDNTDSAILLGCLGGIAFWVRSDLMVFSYSVPAAFIVFGDAGKRRRASLALALTVGLTAAQMAFSAWYFDSPLPLPFYCKGLNRYGKSVLQEYWSVPWKMLFDYMVYNIPVFAGVGAGLLAALPSRGRTISILDRGLLAACAVFIGYYLLMVTQIMYYGERFYYPTFPVLVYLGLQGVRAAENWARRKYPALPKLAARVWSAMPVVTVLAAVFLSLATIKIVKKNWGTALSLDHYYHYNLTDRWYFLDEFSRLPNNLSMASTEVGILGAMNPDRAIIDLAGLNDTTLAHHGFSAGYLIDQRRPDLIFMPCHVYRDMIDQIRNHPTFQRDYEYFTMPTPDEIPRMDLAIRRDSPYYLAMRGIIIKNLPIAQEWCRTKKPPSTIPYLSWKMLFE